LVYSRLSPPPFPPPFLSYPRGRHLRKNCRRAPSAAEGNFTLGRMGKEENLTRRRSAHAITPLAHPSLVRQFLRASISLSIARLRSVPGLAKLRLSPASRSRDPHHALRRRRGRHEERGSHPRTTHALFTHDADARPHCPPPPGLPLCLPPAAARATLRAGARPSAPLHRTATIHQARGALWPPGFSNLLYYHITMEQRPCVALVN